MDYLLTDDKKTPMEAGGLTMGGKVQASKAEMWLRKHEKTTHAIESLVGGNGLNLVGRPPF